MYCIAHLFLSLLNNIYIIDTSSIVLHSNTLIKQTLFSELLLLDF